MPIEPGSSLTYFTGVVWWRSERLTAAILPVEGEPCIVTPFFEEPSVRETLGVPAEVRLWQEDQDPAASGKASRIFRSCTRRTPSRSTSLLEL